MGFASRGVGIQTEGHGGPSLSGTGAKVEIKEVGIGSKEDASFLDYREANNDEIRESFGIGQIFLGTTKDITKGNAAESRRLTNDQEFKPSKRNKEYKVNHTIVADLVGAPQEMVYEEAVGHFIPDASELRKDYDMLTPLEQVDMLKKTMRGLYYDHVTIADGKVNFKQRALVRLEFLQPLIIDPLEAARIDQIYAKLAAYTINELRMKIGLKVIDKDWANLPYPVLLHGTPASEAAEGLNENEETTSALDTDDPEVQKAVVDHLMEIRKLMIKELQAEPNE